MNPTERILTTLKLNKKTDAEVDAKRGSSKAPIRRADPAKRDRTLAPANNKPLATDSLDTSHQASAANHTQRDAQNLLAPQRDKPNQRNHRFDGKPRDIESNAHKSLAEHHREVSRDNARQDRTSAPSHKPKGIDTRVTPRANRDEPQYRQAPRRGGKVRDGFDANAPSYGAAAKAAYKSTTANDDLPRLSKVMAERGLCSRREADEWISNGWVKVDDDIIETLGTRIRPDADIIISSYAQETQAENVTIILHKPVGYVSGQAEDGYQPAVVLVHPDNQWQDDPLLHTHQPKEFERRFLRGLAPAGRLDIDSTGMLVLTQDGRIARHLIGEESNVEKEYLVRVEGLLTESGMQMLNHGLSLDGEKLKPAKVSWQNEDQLRFVLREGKKRQIRRMCEMVGLHVVGLKRVRIGSINLGKLPVGEWRYLRAEEKF